ncbi:MAG: hypothetical protein IK005_02805 [Paludibacteraceae bacterium]|nr:hypothetical protein [Paludibacteraceae bacterium]
MIKRLIIAMMAICAALTFSCCSSDDDDDDDSLTTWSELVSEDGNDWLNTFPEVPGKFVAVSMTSNGLTQVTATFADKDQTFADEYASKVASTSGFSKIMNNWYEKGKLSVNVNYMEAQGQKVCTFQFVKNEVSF